SITSSRDDTSPSRISSACLATPANASSSRSIGGAIYRRRWYSVPMRLVTSAIALILLALPAAAAADPILDPLAPLFPKYAGAPAVPHQLKPTRAPQNPFMARNPRNNIHNDTWMTDAYRWAGPIGRAPVA